MKTNIFERFIDWTSRVGCFWFGCEQDPCKFCNDYQFGVINTIEQTLKRFFCNHNWIDDTEIDEDEDIRFKCWHYTCGKCGDTKISDGTHHRRWNDT